MGNLYIREENAIQAVARDQAIQILHVLDLDVIGVQRLDVAEQVFGQRAAISVARKAAFGPREVRTLQRGPEDDEGVRILAAHPGRMGRERPQLQRTDVLRVV